MARKTGTIRRRMAGGLLLSSLGAAAPASAQQHFPADDDLRLMLRYLVEDGEAPGAVLGVLEPDGSTRVVAYGSAAPGRPMTPDALLEIGSITKTFTATLLADMVLKGEVALDDPVAKYLPEGVTVPSREGQEITLLHLATHRSGLPTVPDDFDPPGRGGASAPYSVEDAYAFLSRYELPRRPGAGREYSNFGFGLLAHALGRAAGTGYRDLVRTRILEPLGMEDTRFGPVEGEPRMAAGHRAGESVRSRSDMEIFDGAGALRSTAGDLLKFMRAHMGPARTDLERAMRVALDARRVTRGGDGDSDTLAIAAGETDLDRARRRAGDPRTPGDEDAHRLAWGTIRFPGESPVIGHAGGTVGFQSQLTFAPEAGIGTVLLTNDAAFEDEIGTVLLYFGRPSVEPAAHPVDSAMLADYAGTYRGARGRVRYHVRLEQEGWLTYQPEGGVRTRMYPVSDSTFYILRGPWTFTFMREPATGDVDALWMEVDEREQGSSAASRVARKVSADAPDPVVAAGNAGGRGAVPWALAGLAGVAILALLLRPVWKRKG